MFLEANGMLINLALVTSVEIRPSDTSVQEHALTVLFQPGSGPEERGWIIHQGTYAECQEKYQALRNIIAGQFKVIELR